MTLRAIQYPEPPAQAAVYVEVLGPDLAMEFFLAFGGAELRLGDNPRPGSRVVVLLGQEMAGSLAKQRHRMQLRVPLVKKWLAACMRARGVSVADIARHRCECSKMGQLRATRLFAPTGSMNAGSSELHRLRQAVADLRALYQAFGRALVELEAAADEALEPGVKIPTERAYTCTVPPSEHRRQHRPGRPPKIDTDPELQALIRAPLARLTFIGIADEVRKAFPENRRVGKSAIHAWWKRNQPRVR